MNKRSTTADEYRKLYYTKRWKQLRGTILTRDGYRCQRCKVTLTNGRSDPRSAVVHHIQPHKGDLTLFNDPANLESVCWRCHSGAIQSEEALGYAKTGFDARFTSSGGPQGTGFKVGFLDKNARHFP